MREVLSRNNTRRSLSWLTQNGSNPSREKEYIELSLSRKEQHERTRLKDYQNEDQSMDTTKWEMLPPKRESEAL